MTSATKKTKLGSRALFSVIESFRSALQSIRAHGFRSFLTTLGIIIGVASVITVVSVLGVTLGIAVMILVISVMTGFDQELRNKVDINVYFVGTAPEESIRSVKTKIEALPEVANV